MLPINRILVPIDWAELSNRAFQLAASLARDHNAELVVLNVVPLAAEMYGPPSECYLDHLLVELRRTKPSDPPQAFDVKPAHDAAAPTGASRLPAGARESQRSPISWVLRLTFARTDRSGRREP